MSQSNEIFCAIGGLVRRDYNDVDKNTFFHAHAFDAKSMMIAEGVRIGLAKEGFRGEVPKPSATHRGLLYCGVICGMMRRCHIFLADVTHDNPNVYFELGYAEASGRLCYLFRDLSVEGKSTFLSDAGIYINEYQTSQDIIEHVLNCRSHLDQPHIPLFPPRGISLRPDSVALFIPELPYYQSDVRLLIERFLIENGMSLVVAPSYGVRAVGDWAMIEEADWVVGVLASDGAEHAAALNCKVAFNLGMAVAYGKKAFVLQEEPAAKPMIDLAGLLERYSNPMQVQQLLAKRLRPSRDRGLNRAFDEESAPSLNRIPTKQSVDDSPLSVEQLQMISEMTGERPEDILPKPDTSSLSDLHLGEGADLKLVTADEDLDDLVLGSASSVGLASDSGINLMSPSESGLSLEEEPLDLAGTGISGLDLGGEIEGGSVVDFQQAEEFQLTPSSTPEIDDDSGEQVIELEDSSEFGDPVSELEGNKQFGFEELASNQTPTKREGLLTRLTNFVRRRPN